jgi:2-oxoglutarate dehydrogenase E1 component
MNNSFIANVSEEWVDSLYHSWQQEPDSVPEEWRIFFSGFELASNGGLQTGVALDESAAIKQSAVQSLIYRYRNLGHLLACTDPLSPCQLDHPMLCLSSFGLDESDLDTRFITKRFMKYQATLREILSVMKETYCREIGVEFMHIQDPDERQWLIDRMEPCLNRTAFTLEDRLHILETLHSATIFETFLHLRFIGQKRFSLEGGEILITALDAIVQECPGKGVTDLLIGMPHRGRLNVLANIFNKPYENIFSEFRDNMELSFIGDGDVKYHKGHSSDIELPGGQVHLAIAANPSHLEAVNPVLEGKCRARQDRYGEEGNSRVLPVLIHGDAAFAGQGSIMEVLNMSQLDGYRTGGTIHIVLNNQIGFTTLPKDSRSTCYATDTAKMLACPVFHVQGEAPEAAVHAMRLAMEYRKTFGRDVVLELICYRRHGHNEGDEPAFTQPLMYRQISGRPSVNKIYAGELANEGVDPELLADIEARILDRLETAMEKKQQPVKVGFRGGWAEISKEYSPLTVETGVSAAKLKELAQRLALMPDSFTPHPKIKTLMNKRLEAVEKGSGIDWGNAETLAYATLLEDGMPVRLSGQDSRRGTFNHRHCVMHDLNEDRIYTPLTSIGPEERYFQVWNSLLSEFGVLGFEYGYSLEMPLGLTLWEAQFGDFANGAQVIIDQFIAAGESKWNRASGLVMLLPHGYEGQGAEHSSARIERYLQLCAHENLLVAQPTTPAQMFHLLRRQVKQSFRKPLIVFTPKSLLRHPVCVSSLEDMTSGHFRELIMDAAVPSQAKRVLLCSGKIYYTLLEESRKRGEESTAIIRTEQLYPFRIDLLDEMISRLPSAASYCWVQEEPENMGAWPYLRHRLAGRIPSIGYVGRPEDCCTAVGSHHLHAEEQASIVEEAFSIRS